MSNRVPMMWKVMCSDSIHSARILASGFFFEGAIADRARGLFNLRSVHRQRSPTRVRFVRLTRRLTCMTRLLDSTPFCTSTGPALLRAPPKRRSNKPDNRISAMHVGRRPLALALSISTYRPSTVAAFSNIRGVSTVAVTRHNLQGVNRRAGSPAVPLRRCNPVASMASSTSPTNDMKPGRVALLQFSVTESKDTNHKTAVEYLSRAAAEGAQLCVLPEIWNGPYATAAFPEYAEELPNIGATLDDIANDATSSPSAKLLMEKAKEHGMFIVGGSIPERLDDKIYNTCLCINPEGTIVGKHRKVHLFDIDVPGGITFFESDTLSPGNTLTAFDAGEPLGMIGVGIW